MYDISVIVPVYNVERYIKECLDSILNQTFTNIQIILVNDGSTDLSIQCIQDLVNNNNNILLINKINGGLSSARNEGLKYATGKYISFIDSDDYIERNFLESLFYEAENNNLDIVFGNYKIFKGNEFKLKQRNPILFTNQIQSGIDYLHNQLENKSYQMEVWCNLYKKDFILSNNLKFKENLFFEDEEFNVKSLLLARKVKLIDCYGYIYRQRSESIMTSKPEKKHIESTKYILQYFIDIYSHSSNHKVKTCMSKLILYMSNAYISKIVLSDENFKYKYIDKELIQNSFKITNKNLDLNFKNKIRYLLVTRIPIVYFKVMNIKYQ